MVSVAIILFMALNAVSVIAPTVRDHKASDISLIAGVDVGQTNKSMMGQSTRERDHGISNALK